MGTLFQPFIELWKRLTIGQRAGFVVGVALIGAVVAGAVSYTTRPVMTTMYSGLAPKDAGLIVEDLRAEKIPFELSQSGTAISVPQEKVSELRLKFASSGLPTSGELGYELFDKPMLGMTDFMQRMNQHRALEGELSRTIGQLTAVENVRVHLVLPTPRLFKEDQKPATASIILKLKPGALLTEEQTQSIAYMTAYSVEGLEVENITIVDTRGNLLSGKQARDEMAGLSSTQLDYQKNVEADLERKALELLENAIGAGRAQVKVTAKLNWNRLERTVENYDPDRTATLSEERQETTGDGAESNGSSEKSVTNYQVPRTIEKYVPEVGNIEHLSASVVVDGNYVTLKTPGGVDSIVYTDKPTADLEKLKNLVSSAIGLDANRNDELTLVSFPLSANNPAPLEQPEADPKALWVRVFEKSILGLVLVLIFLLARSLIGKLSKGLPALPEGQFTGALPAGTSPYMLPPRGGDQMTGSSQSAQTHSPAGSPAPPGDDGTREPQVIFRQQQQTIEIEDTAPTVEVLKHQELLKRTTNYVIQRPANATQILRSWMLEDGTAAKRR